MQPCTILQLNEFIQSCLLGVATGPNGPRRSRRINKWGIDILGPFLITVRKLKFLIVAVDYFSKWIEAEPVATISAERVRKFLWKNVICRYGIPQVLVSDNGTQFASGRVRDFCREIDIRMTFTSVEHPQSNG
uniref:Pol polyprotein n=1 Tax=Cajanus cajan TaxID=3821 RepID=A0A151SWL3_CAJCA|nr:Pol polyprotein [Cajanus cajan]